MRSPSSSATDPQARAWFHTAEFDVAVHTRLTNSDTDQILARAWKFEAVIDAAHHPDLIDARGEIFSDYFRLRILHCLENWESIKAAWDLVSYSVQRNILSSQNIQPVSVLGIFRHGSHAQRLTAVQGILSDIPGLTVSWTAIVLAQCL